MKKKILLLIIVVTVLCGFFIYRFFIEKSQFTNFSEKDVISPSEAVTPFINSNTNDTAKTPRQEHHSNQQEVAEPYSIDWSAISADGVNESQFLEKLNMDDLETIATELQTLVAEIGQKEAANPQLALEAKWLGWVKESEHYQYVLQMGDSAMPPLYWIIYKSEQAGLYEWICSWALENLSGYNFRDEHGIGWSDSKDFLRRFNEMIILERVK